MRFEQIFKEHGRVFQADGTARCKGPEAREYLMCLGNSKEADVAGTRVSEQESERIRTK